MSGRRPRLGAAALVLALAGCAVAPPRPPGPEAQAPPGPAAADPFAALAARAADRALQAERAGDPRLALEHWRVAAALRPDQAEPARRAAELEAGLRAEAEAHHRNGLARAREGDVDGARRELLLALAKDPGRREAVPVLKERLEPDVVSHTVAAGETLAGIAKARYGDAGRATLLARLNDIPAGAPLAAGTVLLVPVDTTGAKPPRPAEAMEAEPVDAAQESAPPPAAPEPPAPSPPPPPTPPPPPPPPAAEPAPRPDAAEDQLARASELLKAGRAQEAAVLAAKLEGHPSLGRRAHEMTSTAWFEAGNAHLRQERYQEAEEAFRKVDPALQDVKGALATLERQKREKAEEHYNEGVRLFINQQVDEAVLAWEKTLALNPEHPKAGKDIEKARALQKKLKEIR